MFHHSNQGELYYLIRFQSVEEHMVTIVKPTYIFIVICLFVIMNEAKKARTIAKSSFTRSAKSIQRLIEQGRPEPELVVKAGGIFETAYTYIQTYIHTYILYCVPQRGFSTLIYMEW